MRTIAIIIASLIFSNLCAQEIPEQEVKTDVNEVTVFLEGAQITRKKPVDLKKGKTVIKFVNLSPFIDAKSVQVKAEGEITVLSVNHQQNYLEKSVKSDELKGLETKLENLNEKITLENTYISIINAELTFLQQNSTLGGRNEAISLSNLQQTAEYYGNKLTSLRMKLLERNKTLKELTQQRTDLQNQINTLAGKKEFPTGEILVKVDAKTAQRYPMELSYLVANAGWFPSYDIRAKNITEPVQLIYKANVKQDTKVDWKNVTLTFSSANPNVSGVAPELQTYFLNYNTLPPVYSLSRNSVQGTVVESNGEPLPGVTVLVDGTTIGTVTDIDGNYNLTVPGTGGQLTYSYIGFETQTLPITGQIMNVVLSESQMALDEVVVTGVAKQNVLSALQGKVAGVSLSRSKTKIRGSSSLAIPTVQTENQTTVDFEIKTPYTINSNNKNYSVDMAYYDLPAFYQYYSVPKIDKDVFLMANIVDWEKYNLLEGEANIFFEDTYIGKTLLDVRYATDTLGVSLGRDKQISVKREKRKDFTTKQFIGNKKEETRVWEITVKNNKNQEINMILLDQVPVSTLEEIEVNVQNISGAVHNEETGEIKWEFTLKPNEEKVFTLKYSVKYPKNRNLIVE